MLADRNNVKVGLPTGNAVKEDPFPPTILSDQASGAWGLILVLTMVMRTDDNDYQRSGLDYRFLRYSFNSSPSCFICFSKNPLSEKDFTALFPSIVVPTTLQFVVTSVPP